MERSDLDTRTGRINLLQSSLAWVTCGNRDSDGRKISAKG